MNFKFTLRMIGILALAVVTVLSSRAFAGDESFVGIGVVIQEEEKSIQIVDVIENSPAARAGVVAGEWLTAVDGKPTQDKKLKEVIKWLKGDLGTKVIVTVQTTQRDSSRDIELTREVVVVKCYMQGQVNLHFYGNDHTGSIGGFIDNQTVNWNVSSGYVRGVYNGRAISLNLENDMNGNIQLTGWIFGSYINWRGYNNQISAFQSCIR